MSRILLPFRATSIVALCFLFAGYVPEVYASKFEYRCLWVVRDAMTSEKSIDDMMHFAKENNFNNVFLQVRGRGDAYYHSAFEPEPEMMDLQYFDPLAYALEKAHQSGINVHAWVNVYLTWSSDTEPTSNKHVVNLHYDWLDEEKESQTLSQLYSNRGVGDEGIYLAPHHPEVTPYLLSVFRELLENYEVDGLHLDYVRYKNSEYGKNIEAVAAYRNESGEDPKVFLSVNANISQGDPQFTRKMTNWSDYRRKAVTDLVKQTKEVIKDFRPNTIFSASVKPDLYKARNQYFQEWDVWIAAGYMDWLIPMNYSTSIRDFASKIEIIYDNIPKKYRDKIIMGVSTYNQPAIDALDKIKYTRMTQFPGVCLFSYNALIQTPLYMNILREELKE